MEFQAQSKRPCKSIRRSLMVIHRMKKKNRESQRLSNTQLFKNVRGLGDSWSNSIRAAADTE
ncbi:pyruvate kinase [Gardnerella vaginalis]|uniref:Pyruvate kinase n=1 Tax=Gardnerella vaginalis TaxID=2702 RepID=A0ABD4ZAJ4_GARVA|nr:pyruvate kinase [Gardnerella vaginalis]MDK6695782.1 pyruvate kinase [Gardnerella vaginalis]UQA83212.1 pyruvate kinase [Gardnerella vaginalis]UQA87576.1 pyruvate kinase [Gardnerella vaginalis]